MGQSTYFGPSYVHLNSSSNCVSDYTLLNSLAIGNNTSDIIIFSHLWGVNNTHNEYMLKSCGLWYTGSDWSIFNETQQSMDTNYAFNVLNANTRGVGFTHTVTIDNTTQNYSHIDNPVLNGHPERLFFITKTWSNGVYDTAHVGIWYDASASKWTVYNEAAYPSILQLNSTYNIFVPDTGTSCFKQVANDTYYVTTIDDARINGNPDARIYVVHDFTDVSATQGYVNDELGVWYDGSYWTIYTESESDLFVGATFNVMIGSDVVNGNAENSSQTSRIKVFPNPAKNYLHVLLNKEIVSAESGCQIVSPDGRTVLTEPYAGKRSGEMTVDVHSLAPGLYFLYVTTSEGILSSKINIVN